MPSVFHPALDPWLDIAVRVAEGAGKAAGKGIATARRSRRRRSYATRRPGADTPLWNALVVLMREELKPLGAKARFARYLGVPRQRLHDFLRGRTRQPDAELTLRMLHWLAEKRAGRDPAL